MKFGFGFYCQMLDDDYMRFARQCGATHAVVHLVDYTGGRRVSHDDQPVGSDEGWGRAGLTLDMWSYDALARLRERFEAHGLVFEAIENFDPALWHDVLLDGPKRSEQIDRLREIIRTLGKVGIRVMGYNFSIAGVAARITGPFARGGAESAGMDGIDDRPIPEGMVWNMAWRTPTGPEVLTPVSEDELWERHRRFLEDMLPAAEEAGVLLAAHPDDPPVERLRKQPRLIRRPGDFQRCIDQVRSPNNRLEFCLGTLAEMPDAGDEEIYEIIEHHAAAGNIGYIHLRNVVDRAPHYREVFLDEGVLDVPRVLAILRRHDYNGVIIPDHTPLMSCPAPWHSGMAFAIGYLRGCANAG